MADVKLCVLGAPGCGKTLLARVLAEQPLADGGYAPTAGLRIQELGRQQGGEHVRVQLWDVAGGPAWQQHWGTISQNVDGVLLVIDPSQPEQERQLEQLYLSFAQPHNLTMKQCMVLAVTAVGRGGAAGAAAPPSWPGLSGKLRKLPSGAVAINVAAPEAGRKAAMELLDKLLPGCLLQKRDRMEHAVMAEAA